MTIAAAVTSPTAQPSVARSHDSSTRSQRSPGEVGGAAACVRAGRARARARSRGRARRGAGAARRPPRQRARRRARRSRRASTTAPPPSAPRRLAATVDERDRGRRRRVRPAPCAPPQQRAGGEGDREQHRLEQVRDPVEARVLRRPERRERDPGRLDRHRDAVERDRPGEQQRRSCGTSRPAAGAERDRPGTASHGSETPSTPSRRFASAPVARRAIAARGTEERERDDDQRAARTLAGSREVPLSRIRSSSSRSVASGSSSGSDSAPARARCRRSRRGPGSASTWRSSRPAAPSTTSEVAPVVALVAARRHADVPARVRRRGSSSRGADGSRAAQRVHDLAAAERLERAPLARPRPGVGHDEADGARAAGRRGDRPSVAPGTGVHARRVPRARRARTSVSSTSRSVSVPAVTARAEIVRAALLALASALAVVLLAPPGGDSAAHLYRTMLVRGRRRGLGQPLVRRPVPARLVLAPLLPPGGARRERPPRHPGRRRLGGALRRGRDARVGRRRALARPRVRPARGRAAVHRDVQLRARARRRARLPAAAPAAAAVARGRRGGAHARLQPARVRVPLRRARAVAAARRPSGRRAAIVAAGVAGLVGVQLVLLALFPSEGRYPFSPLSLAAALDRQRPRGRARVAGGARAPDRAVLRPLGARLPRRLPRPVAVRRQPHAAARRSCSRSSCSPRCSHASVRAGSPSPRSRFALAYNLGPDVSALPKRAADTAHRRGGVLAPGARLPRRTGHVRPPRRGRADVRPLGGVVGAARGLRARPRLVPADRPRREPGALRGAARRGRVPALARPARRALGAASRRAARADGRRPRGGAPALRPLRARPGVPRRRLDVYEVPRATPILDRRPARRGSTHEAIAGTVDAPAAHLLRVRWNRHWQRRGRRGLPRAAAGRHDDCSWRAGGGRFALEPGPRARAAHADD